MFCKEFQIDFFLNQFWITAFNVGAWINNFKYQILKLQNQKVVKNRNIFQSCSFVRSNYNSKAISSCCGKPHPCSNDGLRAVSSAQVVILHRTSSGRQLK